MTAEKQLQTTGRRKRSIARIVLTEGDGKITINKQKLESYFPYFAHQNVVLTPFHITNRVNKFNVNANVVGGGIHGQAEAIRLAISKALLEHDKELRPELKANGLLKRDPRKKERKKYGQPGARKRFQFSKR